MIKRFLQIYLLTLLLAPDLQVAAQSIQLKASVDRDKILIGEPILLQLEGEFPKSANHDWFSTDSIAHFEVIASGKIDTATSVGGDFLKQIITITSFDSGSWTIPMLSLIVNNNRYLTDSINIEVGYTPADPAQPYHGLKEIIDVAEAEPDYINYIIAVVTLVAIALLAYLLWKKKKPGKPAETKVKVVLKPYEKAQKALQELKASDMVGQGQVKYYYTQLNDILRTYLRDKQLVVSPDSSNAELIYAIQPKLSRDTSLALSQSLRLADAAKFAKYIPADEEHVSVFDNIQQAIEKIEHIDNKVLS